MKAHFCPLARALLAVLMFFGIAAPTAAITITRGPYLQQGTPTSMVVRWRTDVASASLVRFGTSPGAFTVIASNASVVTEHIIPLTGLPPDTKYYYQVGTGSSWFGGDTNDFFITAPPIGTRKPTRIWVLGDSGEANADSMGVRDAYLALAGSRPANVFLMLGDNAYDDGTDAEYQAAVFNMYPTILQNTVLWPTIGNHDAHEEDASGHFPYFDIFTLPTQAEAGGVPSGTEKYYSFDYANIHFICLDSMTSSRATNGPMSAWLRDDLAATSQEWIIAYWHHPPYSKGTHNSDTEVELIEMRQNFVPILESFGVDLVLCGHSHNYERSWLMDGHYGPSSTFSQTMKKNAGDGRENGNGAYTKPSGEGNEGAVYAVAGSSAGGSTPLAHPALLIRSGQAGSLIIDVSANRLDYTFLTRYGTNGDWFTLIKTGPVDTNPPAPPLNLVATAVGFDTINLSWEDASTNEAGFKIERSTNGINFASLSLVGAGVTNGADIGLAANRTSYYRVRAWNSVGDSPWSEVALATTLPLPPDGGPPAAITNLVIGNVTSNSVTLFWTAPGDDANSGTARSYDLRISTQPITALNWSSATALSGEPLPLPPGNSQAFTVNGLSPGTTYYFALTTLDEVLNESPLSNVPGATIPIPPTPDGLRQKWFISLTGGMNYDLSDPAVQDLLTRVTASANAQWSTLNKTSGRTFLWPDLTSTANSSQITVAYNRLLTMALAWATWGGPLYTNTTLGTDIVSALDWMYANRYSEDEEEYDNWWDWEIGAPMALNDVCVLMYSRLTAAQLANYMTAVNNFTPSPDLTGANRVWKTRVVAIRAALVKDTSKLTAARDGFSAVFPYVTSGDGFYADGSFLQHERHPYTGGYGASLLESLGRVVVWLEGSPWAITNPARTNVANWVFNSYAPVVYRGALMDMVRGREIARIATDHDKGRYVMESMLRFADYFPTNQSARVKALLKHYSTVDTTTGWTNFGGLPQFTKFRRILDDATLAPAPEPIFHQQYPNMDCVVHTRPGFGLAIRMSSARIFNYESINSENTRGWFTGDGMTYLYNDDVTQFDDGFWPTVNPYRLPGTTVDTTTRANASGQEYLSPLRWVGGSSLEGIWGAVGMDLDAYNSTLVAKKSWFCFDDEIVCLGAGITCSGANRIETTIENRRLGGIGDTQFQINGAVMPVNAGWSNSTAASWCWLDGAGGYYLPGSPIVRALRERRTGLWTNINQRYGVGGATNHFLTLWLDHGIQPAGANYNYVLLPNKSASETAAYATAPQTVTLQNTAQTQAVREATLGITAVNFWSAGTVDFVTSSSAASVIVREDGDRILVGVSDPTQNNSGSVTVTLGRSASALVSADSGISITRLGPTIQFTVSVSGRRGQTLRAVFVKGPPAVTLTTPTNNAVFNSPATIPFAATVASNSWPISKVEFLANNSAVGESTTPPYNFAWTPPGGGNYALAARAVFASGTATSTQAVTINYRLPPAVPADFATTAVSTNEIALAWTETATDEDSFLIERSADGTNFVQILSRPPNATNATDSALTPDTTYIYRLRAHNAVGYSAYTDFVSATTFPPPPDTNAPAAITNLFPIFITSNSVTLRWSAPGDDDLLGTAASYDLRISTDPIDETNWATAMPIPNVPAPDAPGTGQFFTVGDLLPGMIYFFAIKTTDDTNNISPLSNVPGVATPAPDLPTMPSGLTATAIATNEIDLAWTDNSDTEDGFLVERSTDGLTFELLGGVGSGGTSAADLSTIPSTTYWYRVSATNAAGASPASEIAAATTPDPIPPDSTAPGTVTNLTIIAVTSNSMTLRWSAPGDDDDSGTAAAYDLRYSATPITLSNFAAATPLPGVPAPQIAGSEETVVITGLMRGTTYYFALMTADDSNNASKLSNIPYATTPRLPPPWLNTDIGSVGLAGSAAHTNGVFTVRGAGSDIGSSSDRFHVLYQPATGDCEIIARVTTISNTSSTAKSGVMIRETTNSNSRFAMLSLSPDRRVRWLRRTSTGNSVSTTTAEGSNWVPPFWLRVTRTNNVFSAWHSTNGVTWIASTPRTFTMGTNSLIGLGVTSRTTSRLNTSKFDNVTASP